MTTIHAYTGTQMILDGPRGKNVPRQPRRSRRTRSSTPPARPRPLARSSRPCNGKLQGHAQRVAVIDGSVTELTSVLEKSVDRRRDQRGLQGRRTPTLITYGYNA
jgi:glyceraldehyde 3-phosphate dehydrogenase